MLNGTIILPSSKSISNRILIIKALSGLVFEITNLSDAKDTQTLLQLLSTKNSITFDVGHAGTAMRFLTTFLAIKKGEFILTGSERMQQRPIKILVDALRGLGAEIEYLNNEGFPPLKIKGKKLSGGEITIDGSVSSQYISALMLVAPYMEKGLKINFEGQLTSKPYLEMTVEIMRYFGSPTLTLPLANGEETISQKVGESIVIKSGKYQAKKFYVEPDWSAASYWYGMVALAKHAEITLLGLKQESVQGDSVVAKMYENFGVKTEFFSDGVRLTKNSPLTAHHSQPITHHPSLTTHHSSLTTHHSQLILDFTNCPDLAQTVAVTCAALNIEAKLTGLHTLRIKETNRVAALQTELNKLGFKVEVENDDLIILPSLRVDHHSCEGRNLTVKTYNDHRMAMSFAPLALLYPIAIEDEKVVVKSYPNFWEDLKSVGFEVER